ncbi:GDSL-type esterase/lipase family protein [Lactobacillus sp. PSON]|uniref:GDSL-type esterase/lipase family protein n=1 Tax=Lactobacillus sp. PSON TaxID=3455454 RepID=UPI0040417EB0
MKIFLTGDSIIARYEGLNEPRINYELKRRLGNIELVNTAVSGINSGAFFARLSELVLKAPICDKIVILLGTNDLATHKQVPMKQFKRNMELIASSIICLYWPQNVILVSPPAVDEKKQRVRNNFLVKQYAKVIKEVAQEYKFTYINLVQEMINHGDLENLCHGIKNDGLHFGKEGYKLLAELIIKDIN